MTDPAAQATHYRWDAMPREELGPLIGRRMIAGERMMIAHVYMEQGNVVPWHDHDNEQLTYILEGALEFTLGEGDAAQKRVVRAGEVLVIPSGLPHSAVALEDTLDVDIFAPPRRDWLDKSDDYLRG